MGKFSRNKTPQQLAKAFRKQNWRTTNEIHKLIRRSYLGGYLKDFELNAVLGYFNAIRSRNDLYPDQAFVNTLAHIHDHLVQTINERNLTLDLNGLDIIEARPILAAPLPSAPPAHEVTDNSSNKPSTSHNGNIPVAGPENLYAGALVSSLYPTLPRG